MRYLLRTGPAPRLLGTGNGARYPTAVRCPPHRSQQPSGSSRAPGAPGGPPPWPGPVIPASRAFKSSLDRTEPACCPLILRRPIPASRKLKSPAGKSTPTGSLLVSDQSAVLKAPAKSSSSEAHPNVRQGSCAHRQVSPAISQSCVMSASGREDSHTVASTVLRTSQGHVRVCYSTGQPLLSPAGAAICCGLQSIC